ncbi:MAG: DUF2442 domain-containing protein [Candidatus Symbiothrix sp.]|jgi:hypothetical protein|nr:DUF2442 domain-containing protein [Candidatus Symbiothrix sp.]
MEDLMWVKDAKYLDGYRISVLFSDDIRKTVDLTNQLYGEVFEPLKDINKFKRFSVSDWTVEWENGADYAPEFLYQIGV